MATKRVPIAVKKIDRMCVALYIMSLAPNNAESVAQKVGVSRATITAYTGEFLAIDFVRSVGSGRYKATKVGKAYGKEYKDKYGYEYMIKQGKKIVEEKYIEVCEQKSYLEELL